MKNNKLSDYLSVILKWKKFIIINLIIVIAITTVYTFFLPEKFKATATITLPPENSMGLGGLSSLIGGGNSAVSLGAKLFGVSATSEDLIIGILRSRTALTNVINKFNLKEYYGAQNSDKLLGAFYEDITFEPNENGFIEISVINKEPKKSAAIANYFVKLVDSMNIELNVQQAKNNRLFIEKRYFQNVADLKIIEDSMYKFQKKYGIFAVPEQLEVSVKAAAEIEGLLAEKEVAANLIKSQYGEDSPYFKPIDEQVKYFRKKVEELKNSSKLSSTSNVLFPFKEIPEMSLEYFRLYREIELQSKIMEFILPMYEQAKVEEQKSIPTVMVIDNAVPPQLKESPKKAFIIVGITTLFFLFLLLIVFWGDRAYKRIELNNEFERKETNFFLKLKNLYRLKF